MALRNPRRAGGLFTSGRLGCLQAACAVSMFLPFLGRGAALSRGHRVRSARTGALLTGSSRRRARADHLVGNAQAAAENQ